MRSNERNVFPCNGHFLLTSLLVSTATVLGCCLFGGRAAADPTILFEEEVLPLLARNCHRCHGHQNRQANLDLRTLASMLRGSRSGPVIVRGHPEQSRLLYMIDSGKMPPTENQDEKLTPEQVALVRHWIESGAQSKEPVDEVRPRELVSHEDRQFWAFRKLREVTQPQVKYWQQVRNPVDRFVLARLEAEGLTMSPDAGRVALIRRAFFDLIGLPPTPQEVAAFLADESQLTYSRLIDRLLDSPQFGERWGRHWMDEAGYADTYGTDNDAPRLFMGRGGMWRYRDYVVRSFNEDKTFDQFITEQLAGDELVDWRNAEQWTREMREKLIATGFLRFGVDVTDQDVLNTLDLRYDALQRTGEILASNLLALTLECTRCHSHKYEPIPQRDYYRMMSFFQPAYNPDDWLKPYQRALPGLAAAKLKKIERAERDLQQPLDQLRAPYQQRFSKEKYEKLPELIRSDTKTAIQTPAKERNRVQRYLARKLEKIVQVTPQEIRAAMDNEERSLDMKISQQLAELKKRREEAGFIQAFYEVGQPPHTRLFYRGDERFPQEAVSPGFLTVLCDSEQDALLGEIEPRHGSSGRRLALARWLTNWNGRSGALVARVRVNRIWQRLFGEGIVPTSGNLGQSGQSPTHPDLLEWLAGEFVRQQGSYKPLIKLLMTSTAYRQTSSSRRQEGKSYLDLPSPKGEKQAGPHGLDPRKVDPDNQWLWRMRLRRLESEIVRDAILAVSGKLDRKMEGHPVMLRNHLDGSVSLETEKVPLHKADGSVDLVETDGPTRHVSKGRKSVYLLARRNYHLSILAAFDQPAMTLNCVERTHSAVVSQTLVMLNGHFVIEHADFLAKRLRQDPLLKSTDERIRRAFQMVLARPPTDAELAWGFALLEHHRTNYRTTDPPDDGQQQALAELCQMLFNTNEFLYVP